MSVHFCKWVWRSHCEDGKSDSCVVKVDSGPHGCPLILLPRTCKYVSLPGLRNSAAMIKLRVLSWIDYSEWSRGTHCNHKGPEEKTGYQKGEEKLLWWLRSKDCLPTQESQVWSLAQNHPTCRRAMYGHVPELGSLCSRAWESQLLSPQAITAEVCTPRSPRSTRAAPATRGPCAATTEEPPLRK